MRPLFLTLLLLSAPALAARGPIPAGGFKSCKAANAAGYYDIRRGEPAYSKRLDRDGDGMADHFGCNGVAKARGALWSN